MNIDKVDNVSIDSLYRLINISMTVNDNYDNFEVVLQRLLHAIEIITQSEATSLLVYDNNKKDLIFRFATGLTAHDLIGLRVPSGQGVAHHVANSRQGIVVNDPEDFDHYKNIDKELNYSTQRLIAYPVLDDKGEVFGVVEACNKKNNERYSNDDFKLLSIFCQQAEITIRHALHIHNLKQNVKSLTETVEELQTPPIICESKELRNQVDLMHKLATSDSSILISGDFGTGKTLFAKHIHKNSHRHFKLISIVDCVDLVNSTSDIHSLRIKLWGIDKNYKTGIKKDIVGLFEKANGSTIILDEVWALPLEVQHEVTKLLQRKLFNKVDSKETQTLDIRLICTSSKDLNVLVQEKLFLEELFFLINSLSIRLSPINNRIDDLSAIAEHYIKCYIKFYHKTINEIDPKIFTILKRYVWEYNLHSLLHTIKYIVMNCSEKILSSDYVAECMFILIEGGSKDSSAELLNNDVVEDVTLKDAINKFKSQYIHKKLLHNKWNHTKTAKELDIQRSYLSRLVKEFGFNNKNKSKPKG